MKNNLNDSVIKRILMAFDCRKLNDIAALYKISQQNLNGYINRGTFIKLVEPELYKRKINLDWIKTGQGEMHESQSNRAKESYAAHNIADLRNKTRAVLESNTIYSTILKDIIEAYYTAITYQEDLAVANKRIDELEEQKLKIKGRLPAIGE